MRVSALASSKLKVPHTQKTCPGSVQLWPLSNAAAEGTLHVPARAVCPRGRPARSLCWNTGKAVSLSQQLDSAVICGGYGVLRLQVATSRVTASQTSRQCPCICNMCEAARQCGLPCLTATVCHVRGASRCTQRESSTFAQSPCRLCARSQPSFATSPHSSATTWES